MVKYLIVIPALLLFWISHPRAQEATANNGVTGEGWIYELDSNTVTVETSDSRSAAAATVSATSTRTQAGTPVIGLILGGQGKEGIAEHRTLQVID